MKKEDITVAQTIYSRVRAEFRLGTTRINKAEILEWTITYVEDGVQKTANKDTIGRKLRTLIRANYLGAETENGQTIVVPAQGVPRALNDTEEALAEPNLAPRDELPPEPPPQMVIAHFKDGSRRAVPVGMVPADARVIAET